VAPSASSRAAAPAARAPSAWSLRRELSSLVQLAVPVALAEVGWMAMGVVDTAIVGRLGADAIGAVGVGSNIGFSIGVSGTGILLGLDYLVSEAHGGGRRADAHDALVHGLWLAAIAAIVLAPLLPVAATLLPALGVTPEVRDGAAAYLRWSALGVPPLLFFAALRRYAQAVDRPTAVTAAMLTANVVNVAAGLALVLGVGGVPALGVPGIAIATTLARCWMLAWLAAAVFGHARRADPGLLATPRRPRAAALRRLAQLGAPAAGQILLEVSAFTLAGLLAARLDAPSIAAHQIALMCAALAFMLPLGVSSATAVRVGQALGRRDRLAAVRAGWTGIGVGAAVMTFSALLFLLAPELVLRVFTDDPAVLAKGRGLLAVAAAFQLFDGVQVVATGALRGLGDTRTPMLVGLAGHWLVGLPVGATLCFAGGLGVVGLWMGLSTGLVTVALSLLVVWRQRTERGHAGS